MKLTIIMDTSQEGESYEYADYQLWIVLPFSPANPAKTKAAGKVFREWRARLKRSSSKVRWLTEVGAVRTSLPAGSAWTEPEQVRRSR